MSSGRAALTPARFDPSIPANAVKFDAVERLVELASDLGCSLPPPGRPPRRCRLRAGILGPRSVEDRGRRNDRARAGTADDRPTSGTTAADQAALGGPAIRRGEG